MLKTTVFWWKVSVGCSGGGTSVRPHTHFVNVMLLYIIHYTSPNRRISQRIPACPGNSESWHLLFEHTEQGGQVDLPICPPAHLRERCDRAVYGKIPIKGPSSSYGPGALIRNI